MSCRALVWVGAFVLSAGIGAAAAGDRRDQQISRDTMAAVNTYSQFTIFDEVGVDVRDGIVTLTGKVTMPFKRGEIEKRIAQVAGVRDVRVEIAVLPASSFDDELRARIARAIYGNAMFWSYAVMPNPPIHIIVEHGRVTLTGLVRTSADRALAGALATQTPALSLTNHLKTDAEVGEPRGQSQ